MKVSIMLMSGVDDGHSYHFDSASDGKFAGEEWTIRIGRENDNDIVVRDLFTSRHHARLLWKQNGWWLENLKDTNRTYIQNDTDFFKDVEIQLMPVREGQMFRVGRTWLRIQGAEEL